MDIKLPRILSLNLGCPFLISPTSLMQEGIDLVTAESIDAPGSDYEILAKPSYEGEGQEFDLLLGSRQELTDPCLPPVFDWVEQTRFLISTTLKASIFAGKTRFVRFSARPDARHMAPQLRMVSGEPRITLYDLALKKGTN